MITTLTTVCLSLLGFNNRLTRQPSAIMPPMGLLAKNDEAILDDIAVGVNTGGSGAAERVKILKTTWLKYFKNHIVMGDVEDKAVGISAVPSKYYCAKPTRYGEMDNSDGAEVWMARGRCTQMRFLYLLLTLRESFANKSFYGLIDDDIWLNPQGFAQAAQHLDPQKVWMVGAEASAKEIVWGGSLILSSAAVSRMSPENVMTWASQWEFACAVHGCCDAVEPPCYRQGDYTEEFAKCNNKLLFKCANQTNMSEFINCRSQLEGEDDDGCSFRNTRPEFPVPMFYHSKSWDGDRGDDHVLSFIIRDRLQGQVIAERRMRWDKQALQMSNLCWEGWPIISQHHLDSDEIDKWDRLWRMADSLWQIGNSSCPKVILSEGAES